jgi:hypothetical protein
MTARTDLDNAFSILDAGITAHVNALKTAHAAVADESYLQSVTAKVIAFADTLNASNPVVPVAVVPAAVIASTAGAATVAPQPAPVALVLTPAVAQAAQVAQVLPVAPVAAPAAPAATPDEPDGHVPSVLETMEAAVKAMMAHK